MEKNINIDFGYGLGSALAITISWSMNRSIAWVMLYGFLSWFYVIYYAIEKGM